MLNHPVLSFSKQKNSKKYSLKHYEYSKNAKVKVKFMCFKIIETVFILSVFLNFFSFCFFFCPFWFINILSFCIFILI